MSSQIASDDLKSYLNSGTFPATLSAVSGKQAIDDVAIWADAAIAELSQSSEATSEKTLKLQRLNLLKQTSTLAKGNKTTIAKLLLNANKLNPTGGEIASRGQLIRRHYYEAATSVQDAMFEAEPLGVVLAMIDEEEIMEKTDQSLRKAVVRALEIATGNPPLSVASPEFQASIYSAQFFDAIPTEKIKTEEQGPAEVVLEMAKALQRLVYLVRDPEHVVNLFDESLRSAHDVAILSREGFVEKMVKTYKMKEDVAKRIHDHATNIDCRNQETWVQILSSLKNDFVVGVKKPATTSKPPGGSSNVATAKAYNLVDMFKLQFNECEDCCSVFGASAYFQDLMQFLQSLPLQGAPKDKNQPGARNVLEVLTSRRPDLKDLELTCANSAKKVPYITLVNEVLESYATSLQSQQAKEKLDKGSIILVKAFNEYDTNIMNVSPAASESRKSSTGDSSASPLWSINMVSQLFPFRTFPYSLAKDTIETSLSNFDMSIKNLFTLFGPSQRLLALQGEPSTTIYRRAKASSALGLSQEDFFAITGKKLYAAEAPAQRWQETPWSGPAAHTMWGYSSLAAMIDTDEVAESGLCFVQKQLLPRSGVSFTELVELLQTLYFGGRLALVNKKEEFKYESSAISELRLRALNRSVSEETVTTLNDGLCIELQAFLRLKARTGWSIADLDAAVSTVSQRLSNSASTGSPDICGRGISAPIVEELGTIFELSELVSKPIAELLPLWGIIHIRGSKSLYHKLCFSTAAERIGDPVFRIPVSDSRITAMPLRDADEIWKHKPILQVVLRVSADDLEDLRKATGLTSSRVNLSLDNFTRLYRYRTLCSLLKIKLKLLSALREALLANLDIFHSPAVTLRFTRQWYQLLETQWTPDEIIKTLKQSQGQELSEDSEVQSATSSLMADLDDVTRRVESEWQPKTSDGAPTNEDMDYICDLILGDRDWASQVSKFVQGTLEASAPAPRGYSALPQDIPPRIRLTRTVNDAGFRLTLNGLLSQDEKRKTFELLHEDSAAILDIVKRLDDELRDVATRLEQSEFYKKGGSENPALLKQLNQVIALDAYGLPPLPANRVVFETERLRNVRCSTFLEFALPQVRAQLVQQALAKNVGAWCEKRLGNNKQLAQVLLDRLSIRTSSDSSSDVAAVAAMLASNRGKQDGQWDPSSVVLFPSSVTVKTEVYLFLPTSESWPSFKVDGMPVSFEKLENIGLLRSGPLKFNTARQSTDPKARPSMQFDSGPGENIIDKLTWSSKPDGTGSAGLATTCVVTGSGDVKQMTALFRAAQEATAIVKKLKLSALDVRVLFGSKSPIKLDVALLDLDNLVTISLWQTVAKEAAEAVRTQDFNYEENMYEFINMLQLQPLSSPNEQDLKFLVTQLCNLMGWPAPTVNDVLTERYKRISTRQVFDGFKGSAGIAELADLVRAAKGLMPLHGQLPIKLLLQVLDPNQPAGGSQETYASIARNVQSALTDSQRSRLGKEINGRKRRALVEYLLQQEHLKTNLGMASPDDLYEHLLIDVQMGPELETARTKQAVSTIQLFMQRCLMGLEASRGVVSSDIRQAEWAWRQQHSVWQAARRVFLYPENWLEPSIRDDKTPLFREYETRIQQQDLSWESFIASMKGYAQGLCDIADLDIQAYLRQPGSDSSDTFHLFGRTRNAPYMFFYRRMRVNRASVSIINPKSTWSAWKLMELDTLTYETDWNGNTLSQGGTYIIPVMRRNRLFLYLPQISVKAATAKVTERTETIKKEDKEYKVPSTYTDILKKPIKEATPQKYWEIRMAWTELYDGKWSPKRVSQSSVVVQPNTDLPANAALPSIGSFVFEVLPSVASDSDPTTPDETSIRVGCWNAPNVSYYMLGSFSIKDDRVLAVPASSPNTNLGPTLLTTFHKYSWADSSRSEEPTTPPGIVRAGKDLTKDQSPLLAVPYGSKTESRQLTWTLSYGGDKSRDVTGMFVDEIRGSQRSATVFMWPTAADGIPAEFPSSTVYSQSKTVTVIHDYARRLVEAASVSENNIDYLFEKIHTTQLGQVNSAQAARPSLDFGMEISDKFAAGRHELTTPYAIYNWELGLHTVLLAAERFQATQQFDLALRAMKFIFDPTANAIGKLDDPNAVAIACWKFPPFKEVAAMKDKMRDGFSRWPDNLASDSQSSDLSMAIAERRSNPLNAHATARGRTQAYMKWVIFKYVELLIAAGDVYFRRGSLEALPLAIQRYVEASYILGPLPEKVPKLGQPKEPLTFSTFKDEIDLELEFPFICALSRRGSASAALVNGKEQSLLCLLRSPYFCLPANPRYKHLRDVLEDRFYKTRNSLDINGRPIVYSIDEPYLDPARLLAGYGFTSGPGGVLDLLSGSQNAPVPYARFQITVGRALEMCTEVRSMMEQLLAVREKRDGEALALLKARQDVKRQDLLLGLKKLGYEELQITLESLEVQRDSNVSQLAHYLKLLGEDEKKIPKDDKAEWEDIAYEIDKPTSDHLRMSPYEQIEFEESQKAADLTEGSTIRDEIVSGLRMLPSISEQIMPMGMGVTMRVDSHLFADALEIKSKIDRVRALMATNKSQTAARINGLTRQLQERALQANVKGREIKALDKQIAAQKKRMETSEREQALQQREMEWCNEVQTWYQEKFSSEKLYAFMENQLRTIAYDVYQTALDLARLAERAFQYERPTWSTGSTGSSLMAGSRVGGDGSSPRFLRPEGYWQPGDNGGMFAAQQLALDLRRMQIAYIERPSFDYQISKTVSLRQIDPVALTRLQETGTATFEVPEVYFDMDFPGHYMRRLKSVAVSIPAIVGPFTSIAASLVLTSHKYRVSDNVNEKSSDGTGDGSQFRTDKTPITAIAVSSGYQDSGIFDMTSAGEQLAPFEGAGVISSWRLELPKTAVRQFDYRTISDVMLHMKYTSLQGGPKLKQAATESVNKLVAGVEQLGLQDGLLASFSLKADFSNDWHHAQTALRKKAGANPPDSKPLRLALNGLQSRLPFWTRGSAITVRSLSLVILHSTKVTQAQVTKDATSIKLVTSTDSKSIEWDRKESIERSTLLTKDDLQGTKLDDGWELLIASSPDANDIYLIIKYSTGSE
jgi:hypothetical protein